MYYSELDNISLPDRYAGVTLEEKCDLNSVIEQLSEKYRTVIYLKYFSEFTVKEIAFVMNAPEGSVGTGRAKGDLEGGLYICKLDLMISAFRRRS